MSRLSNPLLRDFDFDRNFTSNDDFDCFTTRSFNDNQNVQQMISESDSFSKLYSNTRRLSSNFDDLTTMLADLNCQFNIIGITATKIKAGNPPVSNISLPGYTFISQPTNTEPGGVGLCIIEDCEFHDRTEHSIWFYTEIPVCRLLQLSAGYRMGPPGDA